ncbi:hypothetical protein M427DRAFT_132673 [Gonapodya prolifera JEL478]|uniref:Uncharacterized protein n=1 Tax=Gonapodya prolifera (strain JEL478) TaxID=1344416 RepID=A0A139APS7_GONPJ|nr:hypothetical protein M427DRAFT_132673 [Gonapodya prolifera JEL478]|eukprot:KXS18757.1 hypothetical protein M427DRAFT_132673 [Gonapodya prolifera JEL478]
MNGDENQGLLQSMNPPNPPSLPPDVHSLSDSISGPSSPPKRQATRTLTPASQGTSPIRLPARAVASLANFRDQLAAKEKELSDLYTAHVAALDDALTAKEAERADLEYKLDELRSDFFYNLSLIDGRDKEIEALERQVEELTKDVHEREARLSDIKVTLAERSDQISNLNMVVLSLESSVADQSRKAKRELEMLQTTHTEAIRALKEEHDRENFAHQARHRELQRAMDDEKSAHTATVASLTAAHQHAQHELQRAHDEALSRVKLDVDEACSDRDRLEKERDGWKVKWEEGEGVRRTLEKLVKDLRWDLEDEHRTHGMEKRELSANLESAQQDVKEAREALEATRATFQRETEDSAKSTSHTVSALRAQVGDLSARLQETQAALVEERGEFAVKIRAAESKARAVEEERKSDQESGRVDRDAWERREAELGEQLRLMSSALADARTRHDAVMRECEELRQMLREAREDAVKRGKLEDEARRRAEEVNMEWERKYDLLVRRKVRDRDAYAREVTAQRDRAEARARVAESRLKALLLGDKLVPSGRAVPDSGEDSTIDGVAEVSQEGRLQSTSPAAELHAPIPAPHPNADDKSRKKREKEAVLTAANGNRSSRTQSRAGSVAGEGELPDHQAAESGRASKVESVVSPSVAMSSSESRRPQREATPSTALGLFEGEGPEGILRELQEREREVMGEVEGGLGVGVDSRGLDVDGLVRANESLAAMVSALRNEVEELTMRDAGPVREGDLRAANHGLEAQLHLTREQLGQFRQLAAHLRQRVAVLQQEVRERGEMEGDAGAVLAREAEWDQERGRLVAENTRLREALRSAVADLRRVINEREKLVDACNALRAEIRGWEESGGSGELLYEEGFQARTKAEHVHVDNGTTLHVSGKGASQSRTMYRTPPRTSGGSRIGSVVEEKGEREKARKVQERKKGLRNWNEMDDV